MSLVLFLCLMLMALYSRPGKFALHSLYYVAQHNHGTGISHYFIRSDLQYLNKRVISRLKHTLGFSIMMGTEKKFPTKRKLWCVWLLRENLEGNVFYLWQYPNLCGHKQDPSNYAFGCNCWIGAANTLIQLKVWPGIALFIPVFCLLLFWLGFRSNIYILMQNACEYIQINCICI